MSKRVGEDVMIFGTGSYRDTGCSLHPSCLACPRPRCIYDDQSRAPSARYVTAMRAVRARQLSKQGMTAGDIAAFLGCSRRVVYRYLAQEPA